MKRTLALLTALCLVLMIPAALAEPGDIAAQTIAAGASLVIDLDGDGTEETVSWEMAPGAYSDESLNLIVSAADGATQRYATGILWGEGVYVADLNGDGTQEILLSGDVMSDDYYTWCLGWDGKALFEVLFPDSGRGDSGDGYFPQGYGLITGISDGGVVELTGSQDVLGTWMASRMVSLGAHDRFEFCDNYLWERADDGVSEEDIWAHRALIVSAPIEYAGEHGCEDGILEPGEKVYVYSTDKQSVAHFITPDDTMGILSISHNYERGWGWLVDGIPEDECFQMIPYAD